MGSSFDELTLDQKREYLRLFLANGKRAAVEYLNDMAVQPSILIFQSEKELRAFSNFLNISAGEKMEGVFFLLPDNGRDPHRPPTVYEFLKHRGGNCAQCLEKNRPYKGGGVCSSIP